MKKHTMPRMSRAARWLRGYWPDRNPLRRATDRAEAVVVGLLIVGFLGLAPGAAALASHLAAPHTPAGQARYEVRAVLTSVAPDPITLRYSDWVSVPARARWSTPAGHVRTGDIAVTAGTRAGATVMIWITSAGRLARSAAEVGRQQLLYALAAVLGTALAACAAWWAARALMNRRRMADWDAAWRATGPRWSGRR